MLVETALREIRALPEEQRKLYLDKLATSLAADVGVMSAIRGARTNIRA